MLKEDPAVLAAEAVTLKCVGPARRRLTHQAGDDQVGDGRAAPGGQVIAGAGRLVRRTRAAAGGHVVEIAGRQGVQVRQGLAGAVERSEACLNSALVGDGDEGGELWCRIAGAAELRPRVRGAVGVAIVDWEAGVRIGVVRDVRVGPRRAALGDHAVLVARLGFIRAEAAAAAAPGRFARVIAGRREVQCRAADR